MTDSEALRILGLGSVPDQATLQQAFTAKNQPLHAQFQRSAAKVNKKQLLADLNVLTEAYKTLSNVAPATSVSVQSSAAPQPAVAVARSAVTQPANTPSSSASQPRKSVTGRGGGAAIPAPGVAPKVPQTPHTIAPAFPASTSSYTGPSAGGSSGPTRPAAPVPPRALAPLPTSSVWRRNPASIIPFLMKIALAAACILLVVLAAIAREKNQYEQPRVAYVPFSSELGELRVVQAQPAVLRLKGSREERFPTIPGQSQDDIPATQSVYPGERLGASVRNLTTSGSRFGTSGLKPFSLNSSRADPMEDGILVLEGLDKPRVCNVQVLSFPVSQCVVDDAPLCEAPSPREFSLLAGHHVFSFFMNRQCAMQFETALDADCSYLVKADLDKGIYAIERLK